MNYKSLIITILSTIMGIAMMIGTVISPAYAASIHQISDLDFERQEFFSQDLSNTNQIEYSKVFQFESAVQIAPNLLSTGVNPGTCQAARNSTGCRIITSNCTKTPLHLPVATGVNCACQCQRVPNG